MNFRAQLLWVLLGVTQWMGLKAQSIQVIQFEWMYGQNKVNITDSGSAFLDSHQLQLHELKCYVSTIQFLYKGKVVAQEENSYHLIDARSVGSQTITLALPNQQPIDELRLNIGIDSLTSVGGVKSGDLDPTQGMYWAWQSGYINCKIEGRSDLCTTRNKEFQFHLGGYLSPYNNIQPLHFMVYQSDTIRLKIDLQQFFQHIDLAKTNQIMSPREEAVVLARYFAQSISVYKP